ncbi:enoyl-CoA hydratase-related protein [Mycetocola zhadangensis]|uniref:enoyl-CoA hydratase-related protein n=1 Tax=Mycetocola zhadangensis TaxID=1164595 RepID=UPI003A4DA22D
MVSSDVLSYETRDRKCFITLNRPQAMNALNLELREAIVQAFTEFNADDDLLVAVLTGAGGRAFSAGADLKEMSSNQAAGGTSSKSAYPAVAKKGGLRGMDEIDQSAKPVIAAVDGYCLAGGFELALYCDIRLATTSSVFGLPEPRRSLLAGPGLINLSRMIPLGEALRMQLTGMPITAERAHQIGLVSELVDDRESLLARAEKIADEILECAPLAVQYVKRIVKEGRYLTVDDQWRFSEMFSASIAETEDALEGPKAFAEKRTPQWKMR